MQFPRIQFLYSKYCVTVMHYTVCLVETLCDTLCLLVCAKMADNKLAVAADNAQHTKCLFFRGSTVFE